MGKPYKNGDLDPILPVIDSLLPNSALLDEAAASGVAIERAEHLGTVQFLNLTTFLISNNLPGEASGEKIYKWLKDHGSTDVLNVLSSMEGFTAKALLENLFRLAVEAEDIPTVKYLLKAEVNPNGHNCRDDQIPDTLTPLQFACIMGNSELAQELIKAGSRIDEPGSGWKSSALVLAIISGSFWYDGSEVSEDYDTPDESDHEDDSDLQDDGNTQHDSSSQDDSDSLLRLVISLIDAGASINLEDIDSFGTTRPSLDGDNDLHLDNRPASLLHDGHSPLTAASKYRHKEIVDLLIQNGANVEFLTDRETSALQECLYSWEEMKCDVDIEWGGEPRPSGLSYRGPLFRGSLRKSRIIGVVRSLLDAGADANYSTIYEFTDKYEDEDGGDYEDYVKYSSAFSPLDLAVYTEVIEVVEMLLCGGANATERSLEVATDIQSLAMFDCLLKTTVPVSKEVLRFASQEKDYGERRFRWMEMILTRRQDIQTRRAAMIEAIRLGAISIVEDLLNSETSDSGPLLEGSPELAAAIEECCSHDDIGVLRRILDRNFKYRSVVVLWLGHSIHEAVLYNHPEVVNMLVAAGADVNAMTPNYQTALLAAIQKDNKVLIRKFLKAGAALNAEGNRCLHVPGHQKLSGAVLVAATVYGSHGGYTVLEDLIEAGADINAPGSTGIGIKCSCQTPLTAAIPWGGQKWIERLISEGAAVNNPPEIQMCRTPLSAAAYRRSIPLVQLLLGAGANPEDAQALEAATDNVELLQFLLATLESRKELRNRSNLGRRAIDKAIRQQDTLIVSTILDSQLVDLNSVPDHSSVLYEALKRDFSPDLEIIRLILSSGADPNSIVLEHENDVQSALLVAIYDGNKPKVQLLLEAGAHPDRAFVPGMQFSPLQLAVDKRDQAIAQILLEHGADPNAASPYGVSGTPIQWAAKGKNMEIVRILLKYKANPNTVAGYMSHTALQTASRDGCKEMAEILLEHGADVNAPPARAFGATALQFAAIEGFLGIAYLLLENGADANAAPAITEGRTALEGAAEHGRIDMVQLLLNAGADIHEAGQGQYERALRFASKNGHHATRQLLESCHV